MIHEIKVEQIQRAWETKRKKKERKKEGRANVRSVNFPPNIVFKFFTAKGSPRSVRKLIRKVNC